MNIILTTTLSEEPLDDNHVFVTVGPNCWGAGLTPKESLRNCKVNAPSGATLFLTRVAPKSFRVDPIDGSIEWTDHNAKNCEFCSVGKGIRVNTDKSWKEK